MSNWVRNTTLSMIMISFAVVLVVMIRGSIVPVSASPGVIRVPDDYPTIQGAIDAANPGDTIEVAPGIYDECPTVDKNLNIRGEDPKSTIVDGGGADTAIFYVCASDVQIIRFTIRNGGAGISCDQNTWVARNIICGTTIGIWADDCTFFALYNNLTDNHTGMFIDGCNETFVMYNNFSDNSLGTILYKSNFSAFIENIFSNSKYEAIWLDYSENNMFLNNYFINNTRGQVVIGNSRENTWDNGERGNYWSDYDGEDLDDDGIGDTPYVIDENNQDNCPIICSIFDAIIKINPNGGRIFVDSSEITVETKYIWKKKSVHTLDPDSGYSPPSSGVKFIFNGWSDGNTDDPRTITVIENATYTVQWKIQYSMSITETGLGSTPATISYTQNEEIKTAEINSSQPFWTDWCDEGSTLSISSTVTVSPTERYHTTDPTSWTVSTSNSYVVSYYHQWKPIITLSGTDPSHTVNVTYTKDSSLWSENGIYSSWSDWCDHDSYLTFSEETTGGSSTERWFTSSPRSWQVSSHFAATIPYYHQFLPTIFVITSNTPKLNSSNYVVVSYVLNGVPKTHNIWDGSSFSDWCDSESTASISRPSSSSTPTDRWDTINSTSWAINDASCRSATFYHQIKATILVDGLDSAHTIQVHFIQFGIPKGSTSFYISWAEWCDCSSILDIDTDASGSSSEERWRTYDPTNIDATSPFTKTLTFFHQYKPAISTKGLVSSHPAMVTVVQGGTTYYPTTYGTWTGWADALSTLSISADISVSGTEQYHTIDANSWTVTAAINPSVSYHHQYKPTIATSGLPSNITATVSFKQNGIPRQTHGIYDEVAFIDWCDANTTADLTNPIIVSSTERYTSTDTCIWTINDASTRSASYYHQYRPTISTFGLPETANAAVSFFVNGIATETTNINDHHPWSEWTDRDTPWNISDQVTMSSTERYKASPYSITSGTVSSAFTNTVTYSHQWMTMFEFKDDNGSWTLAPIPAEVRLSGSYAGKVLNPPYDNQWMDEGLWTIKTILWQGNNIVPSPNPSLHISSSQMWIIRCRVYSVSFANSFRDSHVTSLATKPSGFRLVFPNSSISNLLNPHLTYYVQNGTTRWYSIIWQDTEIVPDLATFDATNGNPTVNCKVYMLTVYVHDHNSQPVNNALLILHRNGIDLNDLYDLYPAPRTNASGYYTWNQLAEQAASYNVTAEYHDINLRRRGFSGKITLTDDITKANAVKIEVLPFVYINCRAVDWNYQAIGGARVHIEGQRVGYTDDSGWKNFSDVSPQLLTFRVYWFGVKVNQTAIQVENDLTLILRCHIWNVRLQTVDADNSALRETIIHVTFPNGTTRQLLSDTYRVMNGTYEFRVLYRGRQVYGSCSVYLDVHIASYRMICNVFDYYIHVVDGDGENVKNANVTLYFANGSLCSSSFTNSSGWIEFEDIPNSTYIIKTRYMDFLVADLTDELYSDDQIKIVSAGIYDLFLHCLDYDDISARGLDVTVDGYSAVTDTNGSCLLMNLPVGEFNLSVYMYGVEVASMPIELQREGQTHTVKCRLYDLNVKCTDLLRKPLFGLVVEIFLPNGVLVQQIETNSTGYACIENLPPLNYTIKTSLWGGLADYSCSHQLSHDEQMVNIKLSVIYGIPTSVFWIIGVVAVGAAIFSGYKRKQRAKFRNAVQRSVLECIDKDLEIKRSAAIKIKEVVIDEKIHPVQITDIEKAINQLLKKGILRDAHARKLWSRILKVAKSTGGIVDKMLLVHKANIRIDEAEKLLRKLEKHHIAKKLRFNGMESYDIPSARVHLAQTDQIVMNTIIKRNGTVKRAELFAVLGLSIEALEETLKRLEKFGYITYDRASDEYSLRGVA